MAGIAIAVALLIGWASAARAQQPTRIPRIGYLTPSFSADQSQFAAFRQGLRDLGYIEGKTIVIEIRDNQGSFDRNPALTAELLRLNVDVIVAVGSREIRAAKEATVSVPIVMVRGAIQLEAVLSPVSRGREGTLPG